MVSRSLPEITKHHIIPINSYKIEIFTINKRDSSSANPEISKAIGKRVLVCSEPDETDSNQKFKAHKLKQFRGDDTIQARPLYGDPIEYKPQFGMIFQMNGIPDMTKVDDAIAKTLKIIEFPYQFVSQPHNRNEKKGDVNIKRRFNMVDYYQQFMRILLRYYKDNVYGDKIFEEPDDVKKVTQAYVDENNPLSKYIKENVEITKDINDKVRINELFDDFTKKMEHICMSPIKFGKDLSNLHGLKSKSINGARYYEGVKLRREAFMSFTEDE